MQCLFDPTGIGMDDLARNGFRTNYRNGKLDQLRLDLVKGDVKGVETALNEGVAADHILRGDWNLLMYASSLGHAAVVHLLLKKGANPNCNKDKFTPLMAACASRRDEHRLLECARLLVRHGADMDARDRFRVSALMYAAREGHADLVTFLLGTGANLQLRDDRGWTALFWAINSERRTVTILLLQAESALFRGSATEWTNGSHSLDSEIENDVSLDVSATTTTTTSSSVITEKMRNGTLSNGINREMEIQLYFIFKTIGEVEAQLRSHFLNLDSIRSSLNALAVTRSTKVWPLTTRQLPEITRRALCSSERLFQQMRYVHRITEKVVETDTTPSANYIIEKKTSPFQAWMTFMVTSVVITVTLWQMREPIRTSITYCIAGS